jgi:catechol 2,3-dioxygenase-like lactoylglutathione lyase family enzyme
MPHEGAPAVTQPAQIVGLGARLHLFVQPGARQAFLALFRDVLGCDVVERDFGLANPILLVRFPDGSAFSVEFTDLAPADMPGHAPDDGHAFRGAWIEFRTTDIDAVHAALRQAGTPEFRHPGSTHVYFEAPGGQVFRVLDVAYAGP